MVPNKTIAYVLIIVVVAIVASSAITHIAIGKSIMSGSMDSSQKMMMMQEIVGEDFDDAYDKVKQKLSESTGSNEEKQIKSEMLKKLPELKAALDDGNQEKAQQLQKEMMQLKKQLSKYQ